MSEGKGTELRTGVRVLSLLLAGLLWLAVTMERPAHLTLTVPVAHKNLPAGMQVTAPPPPVLEVTLTGPRILLARHWLGGGSCVLDLAGSQPGPVQYNAMECGFDLDQEVKVTRVSPATLKLTLGQNAAR